MTSKADTSVFILSTSTTLIIVLVYDDDIIIMGSDSSLIKQLISSLDSQFALKDLGQLSYFLGLEVHYTSFGLHLSQAKYIKDLLMRANMQDCKPSPTPVSSSPTLSLYDAQPP